MCIVQHKITTNKDIDNIHWTEWVYRSPVHIDIIISREPV